MGLLRGFIQLCLPSRWGEAIEEESRRWVSRCECGHETSVWEMGGIRFLAAGKPWRLCSCAGCGSRGWRQLYKKERPAEGAPPESTVKPAGDTPTKQG